MRLRFRSFGLLFFWIATGLSLSALARDPYPQEICPGRLTLIAAERIKLNTLEKTFLCGDPEVEPWKDIPPAQVKFHLRNFLQARGYHRPVFTEEGGASIVNVGEIRLLTEVRLIGAPAFLDIRKRRRIIGRRLTPNLLNEVEDWVRRRLRMNGYPCPVLQTKANIDTGVMEITVTAGERRDVMSVTQEALPGLGTGTLRRFDAFVMEKEFNEELLDLTARRIEDDGVLQSTHFTWDCEAPRAGEDLFQRTFAGKPRLITLSFGADTEEYAIFKGSWRHTRWGSKASSFGVSLYGSYRRQTLEISSDWYAFAPLSRWYLKPLVTFSHERESDFHFVSIDSGMRLARTWDTQKLGLQYEFGPNLSYVYTFRGANPGLTRFLSLQYIAQLMSHPFEFWQTDPRTGYQVLLAGDFNHKDLLSDITAQRFALEGKYYYNFKGYDPPLLVFGVRGGLYQTFLASDSPETRDKLPPNYRYFLGGSHNLRGFARKELPKDDGALSAAFLSAELRLAKTLPLWIEPLVFFDVGVLGDQAFHFDGPVYYSPGGGFRVASPVGVFRTTFSHGFKTGQDGQDNTHFQFFISFGEEF